MIGGDTTTSVHIGWILHTMAFFKAGLYLEFCSGALRDRWLYSPSEALSALGRAWKVIHNEGVWGGGSLAVVGSIYWDESNTSPPSNSHSLLSVFLRLSEGWVEHEDPPLMCLMQNTSHLQQSTRTSFLVHYKQFKQCYEKDNPNFEFWLDVTVKSKLL